MPPVDGRCLVRLATGHNYVAQEVRRDGPLLCATGARLKVNGELRRPADRAWPCSRLLEVRQLEEGQV